LTRFDPFDPTKPHPVELRGGDIFASAHAKASPVAPDEIKLAILHLAPRRLD